MNDQNTNKISDVYSIVTNKIIEKLEQGVVPWHQTWFTSGVPQNLITGKNYRGVNVWLLLLLDYEKNYFLTFKQIKELGGSVKKGEKSHAVIFWKWLEKENKETKEIEKTPFLRYYNVFNISQCDGIPKEKIPQQIERNNNPIETCEKIIEEMPKKPKIQNNGLSAYYNRFKDLINVPRIETFDKSEDYYGTLFHELVHSTGHSERLNRKELIESRGMDSDKYAIEELTAEMGASYLKSYSGIPIKQLDNNAAYIQNWLERLKNDRKFIVYASSQAQKATDYILNTPSENRELEVTESPMAQNRTEEIKGVRGKECCDRNVEIGM